MSQPQFAVVVQNFDAAVSDQICVERGQVIEVLFTEDEWIYIRNVNGHCGYIPSNFCFPLEKLRMGLPEDNRERVSQFRAYPRPTTIHVDTFDNSHQPVGEEREGESGGENGGEGDKEVNSPDSGISCSHQASSTNMESVQSFNNTRETLTVQDISRPDLQTFDTGEKSNRSHTHLINHSHQQHKHFLMPNSSLPVLETVPADTRLLEQQHIDKPSPSPPPLQPVNLCAHTISQLSIGRSLVTVETTDPNNEEQRSSDGDDVFLPEARKPLGIYQCAETYEPKFEGEMPLHKDEIVVVMEAGRGEWVWGMASEGREGLVPKSLLHKYRPDIPEEEEGDEGEGEVEDEGVVDEEEGIEREASDTDLTSSATQTELIINGVVHEVICSRPPLSMAAVAIDTASVSIQTEFTSPNWFKNNTPCATPNNTLTRSTTNATTTTTTPHTHQAQNDNSDSSTARLKLLCTPRSSQQTPSSATTENSISHDQQNSTNPLHPTANTAVVRVRTPSGRYLPLTPVSTPPRPPIVTLNTPSGKNEPRTLVNTSSTPASEEEARINNTSQQHESHSITANPSTRPRQQPPTRTTAIPSEGTGTIQRHRHALRQHARIVTSIPFEPDNEAGTSGNSTGRSLASTRRRMQPTPIVTAVRDYTPPLQAKNALNLRRGDIMYAQPHVPYPYGWVWVYHTLLKKYGYVPKDYIAYMYLVQKDQATILEDVV